MSSQSPRGAKNYRFPLWDVRDGACTCAAGSACDSPGKHPKNVAWRDLTEDLPYEGNYGTAQVETFVWDIDGSEGERQHAELLARLGVSDPPTREVRTGNGRHKIFKQPRGVPFGCAKPFPNIDIKGCGGYVVGPGSRHVNGRTYELVHDIEPAELPEPLHDWLIAYYESQAKLDVERPETDREVDLASPEGHRAEAQYRQWLASEGEAPTEGERPCGGTLFRAAAVGIKQQLLPAERVYELIAEVLNPRAVTVDGTPWPFSDEEIRHKVREAPKHANTPWRSQAECTEVEACIRVQKILETARRVTGQPTLTRVEGIAPKVKDPRHEYDFHGNEPPATGKLINLPLPRVTDAFLTASEWSGVFQYDEFADKAVAIDPPMRLDIEDKGLTETDCVRIVSWFATKGFLVSPKNVQLAINCACRHITCNPIKTLLEALPPCKDLSYIRSFGASLGFSDLESLCLEKFLVSAVRRIYQPGCQVDSIIVLAGPQGVGKSSLVRELFSPWYRSQMPTLEGRDASHALRGYWGIEFSELASMSGNRSSRETVKDFLSRQIDNYRQFNTGEEITRKRTSVFVGTTNSDDFLSDPTGARRYWPIAIRSNIDIDRVRQARPHLWANAAALANDPSYLHFLNRSEGKSLQTIQKNFEEEDPWTDGVATFCKGKPWVTTAEIWLSLNPGSSIGQMPKRDAMRIADILKSKGIATRGVGRRNGSRWWEISGTFAGPCRPVVVSSDSFVESA